MIYGEQLKKIREEKDIAQKDLAQVLEISPYTFSHYEREEDTLPSKYLYLLCETLNISIDYLFNLTAKEHYEKSKYKIKKEIIGERLKTFRKENKLTQVKLASVLNTTHSVIADYERGRYLIATPFLYTICKKYNISADYLLGRTDTPKYLK